MIPSPSEPLVDANRQRPLAAIAWFVLYGFVAWMLCSALAWFQDPAFQDADKAGGKFGLLLYNGAPGALIALALLVLVRKRLLSLWTALWLLLVLYVANGLKLATINTPVLPGDFQFLSHAGDDNDLLAHYLTRRLLALLAIGPVGIVLLGWRERAWQGLRGTARATALALTVAAVATLFTGAWPWKGIYPKADNSNFSLWAPKDTAQANGLVVTLLQYAWSMSVALPTPDMDAAKAIVQRHPPAPAAPALSRDALPDIVILQSESFFDPARMHGYTPEQVLPHFRQAAAISRHGVAWVPTYGGGTIRTEFEVLTGIAMRYYPTVQYPYFTLTLRPMASLPSVLAALGYDTIAVHPNAGSFWNRTTTFRNLGFRQFDDIDAFKDATRAGYYVSDDTLVDHILKRLDGAKGPVFVFAVSMENHGPYDHYPDPHPQLTAAEKVPTDLDAGASAAMRGYLGHIEDADSSLGRLVDALRARHHRTLLLFYGDHLPGLPQTFSEDGFDDGLAPWEQPVPWLLLDTANTGESPEVATASFYFPALLLDTAGIDDHGYFHLLEQVRRDDHPAHNWTPHEEPGLRAIMQLRQRGQFEKLLNGPRRS